MRIEGEPGKSPSMWIKKTDIAHRYVKVDDFWVPAENRTESSTRLGGRATLSIEYRDYKILKANPASAAQTVRRRDATFGSIVEDSALWVNHLPTRTTH